MIDLITMALTERELFYLLVGFATLRPVYSLKWPIHISTENVHHFLLHSVLLNPHFSSYPPSAQYQRNFWKWAIGNLESAQRALHSEINEFEIDPRFYERYLELLPISDPKIGSSLPERRDQIYGRGLPLVHQPPVDSYVTHFWQFMPQEVPDPSPNAVDLSKYKTTTLFESRRMIENGTTGLRTWGASLVLAHYLSRNPNIVGARRVLELGSGVGFLGIVIAFLQLQHAAASSSNDSCGTLYLTDVNEEVLIRCNENLVLPCNFSSTHPNIHVEKLDWFASLDHHQRSILVSHLEHVLRPDVILGADIVFDLSLIPALVNVLKIGLEAEIEGGNRQRYALIALTLRNPATVEAFIAHVQDKSLCISDFSSYIEQVQSDVLSGEDVVYLFKITAKL